ncbi:hypothetical protein ACFL1S_08775 [Pseudomonadota bacterium]
MFVKHSFDPADRVTRIRLSFGGKSFFTGKARDALNRTLEISGMDKGDTLVIEVLNPQSPKELDLSTDSRLLGVFVEGILLS